MPSLHLVGTTRAGTFRLTAPSKSVPGDVHECYVSRDGKRVSCDCGACSWHPWADGTGRLTVTVSDVLGKRVPRLCWHLRHSAKVASLLVGGHVGKAVRA